MRNIDWTKPLSKDDEEWAMQREELHPKIEANKTKFAGKGAASGDDAADLGDGETPAKVEDDYDQWKLAELREEAAKRRPPVESTDLKRAEIITGLRAWDTEHPEG